MLDEIYDYNDDVNPFTFAFKSSNYNEINRMLEKKYAIEMLKTYNKNWVTIPINPFYNTEHIDKIIDSVKEVVSNGK